MANSEACELYIEQEIKAGLEKGQTPYSIGKHLSGWTEKLFETHVKPGTIKKKAQRIKEKELGTNVSKKTEPDSECQPVPPKKGTVGELVMDMRENKPKKDLSQKTAWKNVEKRLARLTGYMSKHCWTDAKLPRDVYLELHRHISFLQLYDDEFQKVTIE